MNLTTTAPRDSAEMVLDGIGWPDDYEQTGFLAEMLRGMSAHNKAIPCRFLYDEQGSDLFDQICLVPEYYPTRTERRILTDNAARIAGKIGADARFIELGAGSGGKAELLIDAMPALHSYVCIDISPVPLTAAAEAMRARYPGLAVASVCGNYLGALDIPAGGGTRDVCFFPGSTIGNFERDEAQAFLRRWHDRLGPGGKMVIGVDLKKDVDVLECAYDDVQGITAQFSLNVLHRANRELGADFRPDAFRHRARYIAEPGHIEISLVSLADQDVTIAGRRFHFAKGEAIHIENSHKYGIAEFADLARQSGFRHVEAWTDDQDLFSVHLLETGG